MSDRVLVTYATKVGSTAEMAARLCMVLTDRGLDTTLTSCSDAPSPDNFDAVIIGSDLSLDKWHRHAMEFLRHFHEALQDRPTWLFQSRGDTANRPETKPTPRAVERIAGHIGADHPVTFVGRPDLARETAALETWMDPARFRAFANWADIEAWGNRIATELTDPNPHVISNQRADSLHPSALFAGEQPRKQAPWSALTSGTSTVHKPPMPNPRADKILVGIDGSLAARHAALWAADDTANLGGQLILIHIHPPATEAAGITLDQTDCHELLMATAAAVRARQPNIAVSVLQAIGSPASGLTALSGLAQHLILGIDHAKRHQSPRSTTSLADQVIAQAQCPVILVPSPATTGRGGIISTSR